MKCVVFTICYLVISSFSLATIKYSTYDVSFLFPFVEKKLYPSIELSSLDFLSENEFKQVLQFELIDNPEGKITLTNKELIFNKANWFLTSFRFDICATGIHQESFVNSTAIINVDSNCKPSLRLIFQPLNSQSNFVASALHLVYTVSDLDSALRALDEIKEITSKYVLNNQIGLSTHPGLLAESKSDVTSEKKIALLVRQLLAENAVSANLKQVTATLSTGVKAWKLVGGVIADGNWIKAATKYVYDNFTFKNNYSLAVEEFSCTVFDVCSAEPIAESNDKNHLNKIFTENTKQRPEIERLNIDTRLTAEIIDNPIQTDFFNTTCISCHVSGAYRDFDQLLLSETNQYPVDQIPFTTKSNINTSVASIINFGYESSRPKISFRVANESILAAKKLNDYLNLKNENPSPIKNLSTFWKCVIESNSFGGCFGD